MPLLVVCVYFEFLINSSGCVNFRHSFCIHLGRTRGTCDTGLSGCEMVAGPVCGRLLVNSRDMSVVAVEKICANMQFVLDNKHLFLLKEMSELLLTDDIQESHSARTRPPCENTKTLHSPLPI